MDLNNKKWKIIPPPPMNEIGQRHTGECLQAVQTLGSLLPNAVDEVPN